MTITAIDKQTALVVIDVQGFMKNFPLLTPWEKVIESTKSLLKAFRERNLPVVLVNVDGIPPGRSDKGHVNLDSFPAGWSDLLPELEQQASDITVTKKSPSAFANTGLQQRLRELGVTQVVVTGISTSNGVASTARFAHELGFNVTLPIDAMTDNDADAHKYSVENVFPKIGEVGTVADVLKLLP